MQSIYLCIDLKTFFASVECAERGFDPFETHLVVADVSRGKGALCLAITPSLKALGIKNRCRLYEIPSNIKYEIACPRMNLYMDYSSRVYAVYLKYVAPEDIHIYSIDEAFLDITHYLKLYQKTPKQLALMILDDIYKTTKMTATVGIGTNMFLAKIGMDIVAKHVDSHIALLDEKRFKKYLWHYQPLTDFWHIGCGIAARLAKHGLYDFYDIAHYPEEKLYEEFGINAKFIIDHAWGRDETTMKQIKAYQPKNTSVSHSQILFEDYSYEDALLVVKEMVELKVLDLVNMRLVSDCIGLGIGYSDDSIKHTGGQRKLDIRTNSYKYLLKEFISLYHQTTLKDKTIRSIAISFSGIKDERYETYTLFIHPEDLEEERELSRAIVTLRQRYGKNSLLKGMNMLEKATTRKRNTLVGGHNAK